MLVTNLSSLFLSLLLALAMSFQAMGQDLIVTIKGDSIYCLIELVDTDTITFERTSSKVQGTIAKQQVAMYRKDDRYVALNNIDRGVLAARSRRPLKHVWRVAVNYGWSFRTADLPSDLTKAEGEYLKDLKNGSHLHAEAEYYHTEGFGFGLSYDEFHSKGRIDDHPIEFADTTIVGTMADDIRAGLISLGVRWQVLHSKRAALVLSLGAGPMFYRDDAVIVNRVLITGETLGFRAGCAFDVTVSGPLSVGGQIALVGGTLKQVKVDLGSSQAMVQLQDGSYESLGRVDLGLGIRFNF